MTGKGLIFDRKLVEERAYWLSLLSSLPGESGLRLDYERPRDYICDQWSEAIEVTSELNLQLSRLTANSDFLIYATMLTVWSICLSRYTGNERVVVGSPALRGTSDGFQLGNMLAIVIDLRPGITFRGLLLQVRESLLAAYARQSYPFGRLVKDLNLQEVANRSPLFDTVIAFGPIHADPADQRNDITLRFMRDAQALKGSLIYNGSLFKPDTVARLKGHFLNLLRAGLADPARRACDLDILTEPQRHYLLTEFNATRADYPKNRRLHELIEEQVLRRPDAIALVSGQDQMSYHKVNKGANQLAHYLIREGVGPEVPVGICMRRSTEMVVGLLAILKAGGAYLPLDPSHSKHRLAYILQESGTPVVLSQHDMVRRLPDGAFKVVAVEQQREEISRHCNRQPASRTTAENLAYVIYTSGSTGNPKGVMIPHRGIVNYLSWCCQAYRVEAGEGALTHTQLTFDLTVTSLYAPLITGKKCVLVDEQEDVDGLSQELKRASGYSLLKLTPAHLDVLRHRMREAEVAGRVNALVIGGEALFAENLTYWREHAPETRLINEYGPTETVVGCCVYKAGDEPSGPVAIGKPIANTQLYLLDPSIQPVAEGGMGEIYVGGEGLGRGYLADPAKTAQAYVPNPYAGPGERFYRTGDLGRHRADGNLEYVGRRDGQVKLRGYRVEIGEVESVLRTEEGIEDAVVVIAGQGQTDRRLIGYVVKGRGCQIYGKNIKQRMREKLPDYMVPATIIEIEQMPLTVNGKIDRRALAALELEIPDADSHFVLPRTPVEEVVAGIWADLLKLKSVGVHSNFFELGGHSLMATQALSRIRGAFDVEISLRSLYKTGTVAGLASRIEDEMDSGARLKASPIERLPLHSNLPLSFAQQRLWFLDQLKPHTSAYNVAVAVRLMGDLDLSALKRALAEVIRRHEILSVTLKTVRGQAVQTLQPQRVMIRIIDLRALPEPEREVGASRIVNHEAERPFDLARGPLIRSLILRLDENEHIAEFTLHHIITDGWSMNVLISEIATLYEAYIHNRPTPLPDLPIQYFDFANWQRHTFNDQMIEEHLAYWKAQLAASPPVLNLPTDRPRPASPSFRGSVEPFIVPADLLRELKSLSRQESATLFMTLTTAYQIFLFFYTGQNDMVIGTDIANRNRVETESLIGFFVNQLPLRLSLSGAKTFAQLLAQVRKTTLEAYAHQDLPFEKLVDALKLQRSLNHMPLFQVKIVMQNLPADVFKLSGLTLEPVGLDTGAAKFDLTLIIWENAGQLSCTFEYSSDLFDRATIKRLSSLFVLTLGKIVERRDIALEELRQRLVEADLSAGELFKSGADDNWAPSAGGHTPVDEGEGNLPDEVLPLHV
jgi:amino acid adenylation domain-containing protein